MKIIIEVKDAALLCHIEAFCKFLEDNRHLEGTIWSDVIKSISKE